MTEPHDDEIVHRKLNVDRENPSIAVVEVIADLKRKETDELSPIYDCVDGMLSELYSTPPSPEAQMAVEFTYGGYRITVEQDGTAEFIRVS